MKYLDYILSYWKLIIAVVVIVIVLLIWRPFKKDGFKATANIPGNPNDPNNALTNAEIAEINDLTQKWIDDIEGYSWGMRDDAVYQRTSEATDRVLVGVYNLYRQKTNSSLRTALESERYVNPFSDVYSLWLPNIIKRFETLNLS